MYEVSEYQDVNIGGTASILDFIVNQPTADVNKIVVASSRAVYGEGRYRCREHTTVYPGPRAIEDLVAGQYEPKCPFCSAPCVPEPTTEDSPLNPLSFYGLTKQVQEQMVLMLAKAKGLSAYGLRYQNVYGPGQSLHNPYTGILAIFSSLARSNSPIHIFEDGQESRDFIYVDDVVEATWRCVKASANGVDKFNVGTGQRTTVLQVAQENTRFFGSKSHVVITGAFRQGDIRHNFADLKKISRSLGFVPHFSFSEGLARFLTWAEAQSPAPVRFSYESSLQEMRERGLFHG
jgi:dTDP-L-rhamnose 4-epimerase